MLELGKSGVAADKELIEFSAKAAGHTLAAWTGDTMLCMDEASDRTYAWNPLVDDGQALRLAVKLRIDATFSRDIHPMHAHQTVTAWSDNENRSDEFLRRDEMAAVRRAIVRAAAEIGRNVK